MKKSFLLVICLLSLSYTYSQVTFNPGLRAGLNFATITQLDADVKVDFYVSGYGALKLTRYYTLQPELTYSRQGGEFETDFYNPTLGTTITETRDFSVSYISLGLMNKFTFTDIFNVHIGPTLDIQAGYNEYTNSDVDLAFMLGTGFNVSKNLAIEGRVKKGLIDVFESDYSNTSGPYVGRNNTNLVFQLGISYTFDLKRE